MANLAWGLAGLASGLGGLGQGLGDLDRSPATGSQENSSPSIFSNSGIMRISSGNFPEEQPWWRANWWCFVCQALAASASSDDEGVGNNSRALRRNPPGTRVPRTPYVVTKNGHAIKIPEGWEGRVAKDGKGLVYQKPGPGLHPDADSLRIVDPNNQNPSGYIRYYNERGQSLDRFGSNNNPLGDAATHIPINGRPIPGLERIYR